MKNATLLERSKLNSCAGREPSTRTSERGVKAFTGAALVIICAAAIVTAEGNWKSAIRMADHYFITQMEEMLHFHGPAPMLRRTSLFVEPHVEVSIIFG